MIDPIRRFRFPSLRFSLRTLFVLVVIVAILLAWYTDRARLIEHYETRLHPHPNWGPQQAAGPPDTDSFGDIPTAWASRTQDGSREWLDLTFPHRVRPTSIVIHETYNPGAVEKITAFDFWGREYVLWSGTDPTPPGTRGGVSSIPVRPNFATRRIKVFINSPAVPGWNEIDAVGLRDAKGNITWAESVTASSTYASGSGGVSAPVFFTATTSRNISP